MALENKSLKGTLTRTLPEEQPQLANFQSVMRQLQNANIKVQPSPLDKLKNFQATTGLEARSTGAITGAIEMGERERLEGIVETARTAVDLVGEQEKRKETQRKDNLQWATELFKSVDDPFTIFSGSDIEDLKLGILTPEMTAKVKKATPSTTFKIISGGRGEQIQIELDKKGKMVPGSQQIIVKGNAVGGGEPEPGGFPKGLFSTLKGGVSSLQKGEKWKTVFDRIKMQFPKVKNEDIDRGLGVEWRQAGAFETFKQKQYKETQPRKFEVEADIWKELAAHPEYDNATKKQWIQSQGFDPEDFNIY